MKLWIRAGDSDDYNGFDTVAEAAEYLKQCGAVPPLEWHDPLGLRGEGFSGNNYISAFWAIRSDVRDGDTTRGLSDDEIGEINRAIRTTEINVIVMMDEDDPRDVAFVLTWPDNKNRQQVLRDIDDAIDKAKADRPEDWNYDDVINLLALQGYSVCGHMEA